MPILLLVLRLQSNIVLYNAKVFIIMKSIFFDLKKCLNYQLVCVANHLFSVIDKAWSLRVLDDSELDVFVDIESFKMGALSVSFLRLSLIKYYGSNY